MNSEIESKRSFDQAISTGSLEMTQPIRVHHGLRLATLLYLAQLAAIFVLAFGVVSWRLSQAPDLFTDEILYTRVGTRVAGGGALAWDSGVPFMIHPPLYFLLEGAFLKLTGNPQGAVYNPGNIFNAVYHARLLNSIFAALTAVLLFAIGRRLHSTWLGLLLLALFILDPFGLRINRRAMLETLAGLLTLAGMSILFVNFLQDRPKISYSIWAGLIVGAALLTKELTFTTLLALALFGVWELLRKPSNSLANHNFTFALHAFLVTIVAGFTYLIYPFWALISGHWSDYFSEKFLGLKRLVGLVQITGWNRPGVSLSQFLLQRLTDYGSSYLLLALGGVATLLILLLGRNTRVGRLLGIWGLVLYPFYAFVALVGSGNDQFFYYLLVPGILLLGYAMTLPLPFKIWSPTNDRFQLHSAMQALRILAIVFLLFLILPYNLYRYWTSYIGGQDNGYYQLAQYINKHVPPTVPINASGDAIKFEYFLPQHPITNAGTSLEASTMGIHYFVVVPKDVLAHYGRITLDMAVWIQDHGEILFHTYGDSYGDIFLYRVDYRGGKNSAMAEQLAPGMNWPSIHPPQAGFVGSLIAMLFIWYVGVGGFGVWGFTKAQQKFAHLWR